MTWTDQQVEAELKAKGPTAFQLSDKCSRCGGYWSSHGNVRAYSGTLEYYAQCNGVVVGANGIQTFTALTTTFLPITQSNAVQPASCNGDVMTDQEVADWVKHGPNGQISAFPSKEKCTRCGEEWQGHGTGGNTWNPFDVHCVKSLGRGKYGQIPETFMPTNLPAGFVRQATLLTPPSNNNLTITASCIPMEPEDFMGYPVMKQSPAKPKETDLSDWKTWRDAGRKSDECACGMKREMCDYHR